MTSEQIRRQFLEFFIERHGHAFVPSSPVVPHDDPTLLFTNAGMNQFKPIFLGLEKREYTRAVNTQKCIRAGGKHNDLDDVGRSRRHHTFFEMLGNWSFGDYFKEGAISMSWELLTKVWKLDPSRIHVSCYEGDAAAGIPRDTEAAEIWKRVAGLDDSHIHYFGKDNFWEMGDTGPCGPCTEIYYDRTPDKSGGKSVNGEDPRVMEIWNNVFIQYDRDATGKLTPLPQRHVDTGLGFERICQVLAGVEDNYAIDLWRPIFEGLTKLTGITYAGRFPRSNSADPVAEAADAQLRHDIAFRVVADHLRCLTFALTDGATPGNEGRGYVLRRILRRAVRFGRQHLELREPFLHGLVPIVVQTMGEAFPELRKNPARVIELIKDEEEGFGRTLDRGIQLFEEAAHTQRAENELVIPAADAFMLHDTYGFPIDLTRIMAEERGMSVDVAGYEKLMEEAREKARAGGKGEASGLTQLPPGALAQLAEMNVGHTDDHAKFSHEAVEARVAAIWNGEDLLSPAEAMEDAPLAVILDRTNFYAEMGGQVGDHGVLRGAHGVMDVENTKVVAGYVLHVGRIREGKLRVGDQVTAKVSADRRQTEKSHTSTHLANWALREVLGEGVQQKGSLVDPEKLRFDFSHPKAVGEEELAKVEALVGSSIERNLTVYTQEVPQAEALKIAGLRAVFGEKYPPRVRVVSVGVAVKDLLADPSNEKWRGYSIEFCGGTHLGRSGEAEGFVITSEESVSKGIRRLVALTGPAAAQARKLGRELSEAIERANGVKEEELPDAIHEIQRQLSAAGLPLLDKRRGQAAVAALQAKLRAWEKANKASGEKSGGIDIANVASALVQQAKALGDGQLIVADVPGASDEQLRGLMDSLKKRATSHAILLGAAGEAKVTFVAAVSDDLIGRGLKAGDWIRETAKVAGGSGGGRPGMAQAGAKDPSKLPEALETAKGFARKVVV